MSPACRPAEQRVPLIYAEAELVCVPGIGVAESHQAEPSDLVYTSSGKRQRKLSLWSSRWNRKLNKRRGLCHQPGCTESRLRLVGHSGRL